MTVEGYDVSHWQSTPPSLVGKGFLIAKATEGTTKDAMYDQHIAHGRASGVVVGAYAFNRNDVDVVRQCDAFIAAAGDVDLYAIDVEGTYRFSLAQSKAFIAHFKAKTGKKIGMYASRSGFPSAGQDWNWVAQWTSYPPNISYAFWQIGSSGSIDHDDFNGTLEQLHALVGRQEDVMDYRFKTQRWLLDGGPGKVTTLGEPLPVNGVTPNGPRLALTGNTADKRLTVIDRARLTPIATEPDDTAAFFAALAAYAPTPVPAPAPVPTGITQAQLSAAVADAKAKADAACVTSTSNANATIAAQAAKIAKAKADLA